MIKTPEAFDVGTSNAARLDYLTLLEWVRAANVCLIGSAGTARSHVLVGLGVAAVQAGHRIRYFTAADLLETLYFTAADLLETLYQGWSTLRRAGSSIPCSLATWSSPAGR
ncbi:MAG: ATP-binding protein [Actinomycetota bacterium]|nr:ATP-binding protein [Actinomycetota bacterium]